jgi:hypothetical protein
MKIVPIDSSGEPVEILTATWEDGIWNLVIDCYNQQHKLTLGSDKQLTIHDHSPEQITGEVTMANLGDGAPNACPCVRIRLWLPSGIFLIDVIP